MINDYHVKFKISLYLVILWAETKISVKFPYIFIGYKYTNTLNNMINLLQNFFHTV